MTLAIGYQDAKTKVTTLCPSCKKALPQRLKKEYVQHLRGRYSVCPWCNEYLFKQAKGSVILAEDKFTVDEVLRLVNEHVTERDGHYIDECSQRERAYVYYLIEFAIKQMNGSETDIGLTSHTYLIDFTKWLLKQEFWADKLKSITQISGHKQRLMADFYEKRCAELGVETPRVEVIRKRLQEKMREAGWKK